MVAKHTLVNYLNSRVSTFPGPISHLAVFPYTQLPQSWDQPDALRGDRSSTPLSSIRSLVQSQIS